MKSMMGATLGLLVLVAGGQASEPRAGGGMGLVSRAYPVDDLVLTSAQRTQLDHLAQAGDCALVVPAELKPDFEPLVKLLTESVAPDTWMRSDGQGGFVAEAGRVGTITPFYLNSSLIIKATPEVHEQVVERLRQLRRLPAVRDAAGAE